MPKRSLKTRILQLRVITCLFCILSVKAVLLFFANYGVYEYPHVPAELLEARLYKQRSPKLVFHKSKPDCKYDEILKSTSSLLNWEVPRKFDDFSAKGLVNGSYVPEHCNAVFSVAIIVAYRNRQSQLDIFLPYIHNFLRKQNIHYRIYVVEQQDEKKFNKGVLYNVGARAALRDQWPCLVLHDVDLLPLAAANLYACARSPRHMSASIDKFRFVLPYDYLTGGVLALKAEQFVAANGFSNRFEGWGGEDDDFSFRLAAHQLDVIRFPPAMSRYTMLEHPQERRNSARRQIIRDNLQDGYARDGLASLPPVSTRLTHHRLFTLVGVRL